MYGATNMSSLRDSTLESLFFRQPLSNSMTPPRQYTISVQVENFLSIRSFSRSFHDLFTIFPRRGRIITMSERLPHVRVSLLSIFPVKGKYRQSFCHVTFTRTPCMTHSQRGRSLCTHQQKNAHRFGHQISTSSKWLFGFCSYFWSSDGSPW